MSQREGFTAADFLSMHRQSQKYGSLAERVLAKDPATLPYARARDKAAKAKAAHEAAQREAAEEWEKLWTAHMNEESK